MEPTATFSQYLSFDCCCLEVARRGTRRAEFVPSRIAVEAFSSVLRSAFFFIYEVPSHPSQETQGFGEMSLFFAAFCWKGHHLLQYISLANNANNTYVDWILWKCQNERRKAEMQTTLCSEKERTFIASKSSSRQCMQRAQASFGAKTRRVSAWGKAHIYKQRFVFRRFALKSERTICVIQIW